MAYVARPSDFHGARPYRDAIQVVNPAPAPQPARRGFWRGLVDAIALSRRNEAQREIEAYVARRGKLTDSMEREIAERLMGNRF